MDKKIINVIVEIATDKDIEEITSALNKGIYYGLDVKSVAEPKNVKVLQVRQIDTIQGIEKPKQKSETKVSYDIVKCLQFVKEMYGFDDGKIKWFWNSLVDFYRPTNDSYITVSFKECDLSDSEEIEEVFEALKKEFSDGKETVMFFVSW